MTGIVSSRSMHRALALQDVIRAIFQQIEADDDKHDSTFLSLALVQRSWKSLALDFLWETLSYKNMAHLARAMAPGTWSSVEWFGFRAIRCTDLDVDENRFEWITPQFLSYCRWIRRILWRFLADGDSELLEDNVLMRWSIYGTDNVLFPNLVTVSHSWHSLDTMDQQNILRINKITARSPLLWITVNVEDLDLPEDEEVKVFGEYTGVVYDFIAGLPKTIISLEMTHRCKRRSLLPMPPLNTFTRLSSLRRLDIGWHLSSNELITLTSLAHLESLSINLSSEECLPSVTYASLRSLDITIQSAFPQKCGLDRLKAPHLQTLTCWLRSQPDDEDVIQFASLLGERKQTRSITFWDCDQGSDEVRESSTLVRILESLSHAHAITLHMRFDLSHADKSSIEAACGLHLSELQLPGCIVAQRLG